MVNFAENDATEQIEALTRAIEVTSRERELTKLYIERAHCHGRVHDTVNSVRDFLSALEIAQDTTDKVHIKSMLAFAFVTKDQKEHAIFWATSAVDDDVCSAEAYDTLGLVCDCCGFLNVAISSLRRAIELEPGRRESLRVLGSCLRENGELQEARETLFRYVESNPSDPIGLYELGWTLHVCAGSEDDRRLVVEMYERALARDPDEQLRSTIVRKLGEIRTHT
jgi:tetratricopeptide (TPR) repeat protein